MFTNQEETLRPPRWFSLSHSGTSPSSFVKTSNRDPIGMPILGSRFVLHLIEGGSSRQDRIIRCLDITTAALMFFMLTIGGCMIFMLGSCVSYLILTEVIIGIVLIVLGSINIWLKFSAYKSSSTETGSYSSLSNNSPLRTEDVLSNVALLS